MNTDELSTKQETEALNKHNVNGSAVRTALSNLLHIASSMVTTGISEDMSEWDLPKNTSLKTKRKIYGEAFRANEANRKRAIDLKLIYDTLSRHYR